MNLVIAQMIRQEVIVIAKLVPVSVGLPRHLEWDLCAPRSFLCGFSLDLKTWGAKV